jgi:hypothetical protein
MAQRGELRDKMLEMPGILEDGDEARLAEERRVAAEDPRITVALDQVSADVTLAAPDRTIIYTNRATRAM